MAAVKKCLICGRNLTDESYLSQYDEILGGYVCLEHLKNYEMNRELLDYTRKKLQEYKTLSESKEQEVLAGVDIFHFMKKTLLDSLEHGEFKTKEELAEYIKNTVKVIDFVRGETNEIEID